MRERRVRQEEDRLDAAQMPVHEGHGLFDVEVGASAQTLDDRRGAVFGAEIDEQSVHRLGAQPPDARLLKRQARQVEPLAGIEEMALRGVRPHGEDHLVEETARPSGHVEVPEGDGVEGARIHGGCHVSSLTGVAVHSRVSPRARWPVGAMSEGQEGSGERADRSTTTSPSAARWAPRRQRASASSVSDMS